jgi:membrane protein implicated in regulation of membrane protease activity
VDADFTTIAAWIVGIVAVFEFFHIGYLVNGIRKEARKQTKLLLVSTGALIGKKGILSDVWTAHILGEDWECMPPKDLRGGEKIIVKSLDGIRVVVEAVEQGK